MLLDPQRLLDSSPGNVALLDDAGVVVLVNQAWREFGAANGQHDPLCCVGMNYFAICEHAAAVDPRGARAVAGGLRAVVAGEPEFTLEYPCDSPGEARWMKLRVTSCWSMAGPSCTSSTPTSVAASGHCALIARERGRTTSTGP